MTIFRFNLIALATLGVAHAQDRITIEVVPVVVIETGVEATAGSIDWSLSAIPDTLSSVHQAMRTLGVKPAHYDVVLGDTANILSCGQPNILVIEPGCYYLDGTVVTDWSEAGRSLYPGWMEQPGRAVLMVVLLPDQWAWTADTLGTTIMRRPVDPFQRHWTNSSCLLWAVDRLNIITHELGHCFNLDHNQDDYLSDDIDLMLAQPGVIDWLKESNADKVKYHFREWLQPPSQTLPMQEVRM